ncbi:MAG TPA: ZIP family metal transporter, partial [Polyangiales bacterium]|nr:ZIP family metal transporter [Polyangiales bacterium]
MTSTAIPYWVASLYGALAALAIVIGGGLIGPARGTGGRSQGTFAAVGAGFLIALGGLGALPEALERSGSAFVTLALAAAALGGMLWLHRFGHHERGAAAGHDHGHAHDHGHGDDHTHVHAELSLHDARMAVAGLALHSLLDGVAVSAALASRRELGVFVAVFVLLHKLPEGAAAAAITYASGGEKAAARRGVLVVAAASLLGAFAIFAVLPVLSHALAITAGVTLGVGIGIA